MQSLQIKPTSASYVANSTGIEMTDHPIIFSAPMVQALLAGRKTMTRRLAWGKARRLAWQPKDQPAAQRPSDWQRVKPGDWLWVKERLCSHGHFGFPLSFGPQIRDGDRARVWSYFADGRPDPTGSRPSIHCPRAFSRLTLIVTAAKIERLQDISNADAIAEGVQLRWLKSANCAPRPHYFIDAGCSIEHSGGSAREAFERLWDKLHGPESWDANPEVVALSFAVHKYNIEATEVAKRFDPVAEDKRDRSAALNSW
jgi:hypothetical protein